MEEVGDDEVPVGILLYLCVILNQKDKIMCTQCCIKIPKIGQLSILKILITNMISKYYLY
jgi:hypothetical protein